MSTKVQFLTVGKNGTYIRLKPDYEKGHFIPTFAEFNPKEFYPFGFCKKLSKDTPNYLDDTKETMEKTHLNEFKELCDTIFVKIASELGLNDAIILIEVLTNQDTGHYWSFVINYQFLLR